MENPLLYMPDIPLSPPSNPNIGKAEADRLADILRAGGLPVDRVVRIIPNSLGWIIKLQAPHGRVSAEFYCFHVDSIAHRWVVFARVNAPWYLRLQHRKQILQQRSIMYDSLRKVLPEMLDVGYVVWNDDDMHT
jgi:hypothetical protein